MDAITGEKKEAKVENLPVIWRVTGVNFRPVNESVKSIKNRGKLIQNSNLILSTDWTPFILVSKFITSAFIIG